MKLSLSFISREDGLKRIKMSQLLLKDFSVEQHKKIVAQKQKHPNSIALAFIERILQQVNVF